MRVLCACPRADAAEARGTIAQSLLIVHGLPGSKTGARDKTQSPTQNDAASCVLRRHAVRHSAHMCMTTASVSPLPGSHWTNQATTKIRTVVDEIGNRTLG